MRKKVEYTQTYNSTKDKAEIFIMGFVMEYVDTHLEESRSLFGCWSYVQDGINLHSDDLIAILEDDEKDLIIKITLPRLVYSVMDSRTFPIYLSNRDLLRYFPVE